MRPRKILLYGSGNAREHVTLRALREGRTDLLVRALIQKENALMQREEGVGLTDGLQGALAFADEFKPDNVLILSPNELIAGDADVFREKGYKVFGVSSAAARLEQSKVFAKDFMRRHQIPTPRYHVAANIEGAETYILENWEKSKSGYVIKADLFSMNAYDRTDTPNSPEEALASVRRLYRSNPRTKLLLEEKIGGYELSLHLLVDGERYYILPPVQDYKKLLPDNEGPMTHGVAAVAASIPYPPSLRRALCDQVIEPTLRALRDEQMEYRSILYIGLMIDDGQPQVLEYNVRSGSPEWLSLLGLLDGSLINLLDQFERDRMTGRYWKENSFSVTSFGLAAGYPERVRSHYTEPIRGLERHRGAALLGESIVMREEVYYPSGGRVFAVQGSGADFLKVCDEIAATFDEISMNGLFYRTDLSPINFT
jgi:phosphoribosylamine--glycine ligase